MASNVSIRQVTMDLHRLRDVILDSHLSRHGAYGQEHASVHEASRSARLHQPGEAVPLDHPHAHVDDMRVDNMSLNHSGHVHPTSRLPELHSPVNTREHGLPVVSRAKTLLAYDEQPAAVTARDLEADAASPMQGEDLMATTSRSFAGSHHRSPLDETLPPHSLASTWGASSTAASTQAGRQPTPRTRNPRVTQLLQRLADADSVRGDPAALLTASVAATRSRHALTQAASPRPQQPDRSRAHERYDPDAEFTADLLSRTAMPPSPATAWLRGEGGSTAPDHAAAALGSSRALASSTSSTSSSDSDGAGPAAAPEQWSSRQLSQPGSAQGGGYQSYAATHRSRGSPAPVWPRPSPDTPPAPPSRPLHEAVTPVPGPEPSGAEGPGSGSRTHSAPTAATPSSSRGPDRATSQTQGGGAGSPTAWRFAPRPLQSGSRPSDGSPVFPPQQQASTPFQRPPASVGPTPPSTTLASPTQLSQAVSEATAALAQQATVHENILAEHHVMLREVATAQKETQSAISQMQAAQLDALAAQGQLMDTLRAIQAQQAADKQEHAEAIATLQAQTQDLQRAQQAVLEAPPTPALLVQGEAEPSQAAAAAGDSQEGEGPTSARQFMPDTEFLRLLLHGIRFTKHGRWGSPHTRVMWLDMEGEVPLLRWGKEGSDMDAPPDSDKAMPVSGIVSVDTGLASANLRRTGSGASPGTLLVIQGQTRGLDVQMASEEERDVLAHGLRSLFLQPGALGTAITAVLAEDAEDAQQVDSEHAEGTLQQG